tara:strand:- start:1754 stop:1981 length:228 start_codon:yes stop_codon:yes gene_type:complete
MAKSVQEQRDEMRDMISETRAYQKTIFKKLDKIEEHLSVQNGRLGDVEKSQSLIKGVGVTISLVLTAIIAFVKGE